MRPVDRGGDVAERVLERGIRGRERGRHLLAEEAHVQAPVAAQGPEPVPLGAGVGDGAAPVGHDAELGGGELEPPPAGGEGDGDVLEPLRAGGEPADRLARGQTADVDAGDLGPLCERGGQAGVRRASCGAGRSRRLEGPREPEVPGFRSFGPLGSGPRGMIRTRRARRRR